MRVLIQPYYFWSGHYKEYTNSLHKNNTICIASSFSDKSHTVETQYEVRFIIRALADEA